jgi:hypothetical protein
MYANRVSHYYLFDTHFLCVHLTESLQYSKGKLSNIIKGLPYLRVLVNGFLQSFGASLLKTCKLIAKIPCFAMVDFIVLMPMTPDLQAP